MPEKRWNLSFFLEIVFSYHPLKFDLNKLQLWIPFTIYCQSDYIYLNCASSQVLGSGVWCVNRERSGIAVCTKSLWH